MASHSPPPPCPSASSTRRHTSTRRYPPSRSAPDPSRTPYGIGSLCLDTTCWKVAGMVDCHSH
ncbi:hypothetical protein CHLRE_16g673554v5 [Chlamydomonas reinhardtii]|uniref:Uncharacterized protein n=1 Tax=Chlamydomonas reinhardtii TaxID=3055 RepID=A0A2K3CVJ3_CHLRE|nr:uncharacterized protein CHLRE_16g673554v5 [Chlamydomonas reinhardtii]PNW72309.1 hypothetical protein CHLRE_16g673554v5 [Chlamydomonas reinhardtii]